MRKVIINGDDFGLAPGVNRGIIEAYRNGVLTSATMVVNTAHFDDAVALARENPGLPLGVHLTLLWGKPVSQPDEIPSLIDHIGRFPRSYRTLFLRCLSGFLSRNEAVMEFRAQIRRFMDAGFAPTHLDTHKHIHCLPLIMEAMIAAAAEFGINKIRLPVESRLTRERNAATIVPKPTMVCKRNLIRFLCNRNRARLRAAHIKSTDHFVGIDYMNRLTTETLCSILARLESGVTEIMCHPGYVDEELRAVADVVESRESELKALTDERVKECAKARGIIPADYRDL